MREFSEIERLANLSESLPAESNPLYILANLTGWAEDYLGQAFSLRTLRQDGWLERHCLGAALIEWNQNPSEAAKYLTHLWENGVENV